MGNKESSKIDVTNYDPEQWKVIGSYKSIAEILHSSKGRGQVERKILHLDPKLNLDQEIEIYQYRKDQDHALVKCIAIHIQNSQTKSLCGNKHVLTVLTQLIPLRLNQLPQLTFAESIYTLSEALKGYKVCYKKLGPFEVTEEMIRISNEGEIKVWVNPDFAQNHPLTEKPLLHTSETFNHKDQRVEDLVLKKEQTEMIKKISNLIQRKCESGLFHSDFNQRINKNLSNFDEAFNEIESYVADKNIFIPDKIVNMNTLYLKAKKFYAWRAIFEGDKWPFLLQKKTIFVRTKTSYNLTSKRMQSIESCRFSSETRTFKAIEQKNLETFADFNSLPTRKRKP